MYYALCVVLGLILGYIFGRISKKKTGVAMGKFIINSTDVNKDVFTVDLENIDDIYTADIVTMKVVRDYDVKRK